MKHSNLIILTALLVGLFSCNQSSQKKAGTGIQNGWKQLTENGYSIQYPGNWDLNKPEQLTPSFFLFSPLSTTQDKFKENVNLMIQDLSNQDLNMDKFVRISEEQIKTMITDGEILESKRMNQNSINFHRVIFTGRQGLFNLKYEQYYIIEKEKAFILTLTCEATEFEKFRKTGEKIMSSFRFE